MSITTRDADTEPDFVNFFGLEYLFEFPVAKVNNYFFKWVEQSRCFFTFVCTKIVIACSFMQYPWSRYDDLNLVRSG